MNSERLTSLEVRLSVINDTLARLNDLISTLTDKFSTMRETFDDKCEDECAKTEERLSERIKQIEDGQRWQTRFLIATMVSTVGAMAATIFQLLGH